MARVRISVPAQADLAHILAASLERWGEEGRKRHARLLARAIRLARTGRAGEKIAAPVHVVYYRRVEARIIEIVRVLHERMDPALRR